MGLLIAISFFSVLFLSVRLYVLKLVVDLDFTLLFNYLVFSQGLILNSGYQTFLLNSFVLARNISMSLIGFLIGGYSYSFFFSLFTATTQTLLFLGLVQFWDVFLRDGGFFFALLRSSFNIFSRKSSSSDYYSYSIFFLGRSNLSNSRQLFATGFLSTGLCSIIFFYVEKSFLTIMRARIKTIYIQPHISMNETTIIFLIWSISPSPALYFSHPHTNDQGSLSSHVHRPSSYSEPSRIYVDVLPYYCGLSSFSSSTTPYS